MDCTHLGSLTEILLLGVHHECLDDVVAAVSHLALRQHVVGEGGAHAAEVALRLVDTVLDEVHASTLVVILSVEAAPWRIGVVHRSCASERVCECD